MKVLLITGATDGIGRALADHYAALDYRLVLAGRRSRRELEGSLFSESNYCQADLAQGDAIETIDRFLEARGIKSLDAVIHNAGIGWAGSPVEQSPSSIRELMAVNLEAPIALTHGLKHRLKASPQGQRERAKVIFISSITAALPCPDYAVYAASKAALDGFARALRLEWRNQGIGVQTICLGPVRTGIHAKAGLDLKTMGWDRFPSAEKTAKRIARAIESRQPYATIGLTNRWLRILGLRSGRLLDAVARRKAAR